MQKTMQSKCAVFRTEKTLKEGIDEIKKLAELSVKFNCTEALLVTGERPEQKYPEVVHWLKNTGFGSTAEYLVHCSELLLEYGLFPHTNAGNLTKSEMSDLKKTNVSMGLMLENSSERLSNEGLPHEDAPSKHPKARIRTLKNAGELKIPITTGILVGIGETDAEIIDSLFTIKDIHPHDIATILDEDGVAIRAGHHCCQILHDKLGIPASARASLGVYNTKDDLDKLNEGINNCKKIFDLK